MDHKRSAKTSLLDQLVLFDKEVIDGAQHPKTKRFLKNEMQWSAVIGTDEVGRGSIAGPVVASCVLLPKLDFDYLNQLGLGDLNDSKAVPPAKRIKMAQVIHEHAYTAIAQATVAEIEELNILHASLLAMSRALAQLASALGKSQSSKTSVVLVDGHMPVKEFAGDQLTVIKGDSRSASIACASIIAKVHRDQLMTDLASNYPHYGWSKNKGYGTYDHWKAIEKIGPCEMHRPKFLSKRLKLDSSS